MCVCGYVCMWVCVYVPKNLFIHWTDFFQILHEYSMAAGEKHRGVFLIFISLISGLNQIELRLDYGLPGLNFNELIWPINYF